MPLAIGPKCCEPVLGHAYAPAAEMQWSRRSSSASSVHAPEVVIIKPLDSAGDKSVRLVSLKKWLRNQRRAEEKLKPPSQALSRSGSQQTVSLVLLRVCLWLQW